MKRFSPSVGFATTMSAALPLSIGAMLITSALSANAAPASEPIKTYWYDGTVRREVWIDPQRQSVVSGGGSGASASASSAATPPAKGGMATGASVVPASGAAPNVSSTNVLHSTQRKGNPGGAIAAMPAAASPTLPGGVIVTLHQPLPEAQAREFLQAQGLTPRHEVGTEARVWLVDSPAGIDTLHLANKLFESGLFAGAQPNWRRPLVTK